MTSNDNIRNDNNNVLLKIIAKIAMAKLIIMAAVISMETSAIKVIITTMIAQMLKISKMLKININNNNVRDKKR